MPNPILDTLKREVTEITAVIPSAIALLNGIDARVQAGIDKALEMGATEAQLADLQSTADALDTGGNDLAAAVAANTPAA